MSTNNMHCAAGGLELRLSCAAGTRCGGEALPHAGAGRQDQHEHQLRLERAAHALRGGPGVLRALGYVKGWCRVFLERAAHVLRGGPGVLRVLGSVKGWCRVFSVRCSLCAMLQGCECDPGALLTRTGMCGKQPTLSLVHRLICLLTFSWASIRRMRRSARLNSWRASSGIRCGWATGRRQCARAYPTCPSLAANRRARPSLLQ